MNRLRCILSSVKMETNMYIHYIKIFRSILVKLKCNKQNFLTFLPNHIRLWGEGSHFYNKAICKMRKEGREEMEHLRLCYDILTFEI